MALVRESLVLEERNGGLPEMADMHQELGHTLEQTGHLPEAWAAFSEHRRLSDEVSQRAQQRAVLELQEGFEAEQRQREMALRGGVNLVMYTLTGNYKADQVHVRDLLNRLGH